MKPIVLFAVTICLLLLFAYLYMTGFSLNSSAINAENFRSRETSSDIDPYKVTDSPRNDNSSDIDEKSLIVSGTQPTPQTSNLVQCKTDKDCENDEYCGDNSICPLCEDSDTNDCTCISQNVCQYRVGDCQLPDVLSIQAGGKNKPDATTAAEYIKKTETFELIQTKPIGKKTEKLIDQTITYVIRIKGDRGGDWIRQLKSDGFTSVDYYTLENCDIIGSE